jgi:hypothetical protein
LLKGDADLFTPLDKRPTGGNANGGRIAVPGEGGRSPGLLGELRKIAVRLQQLKLRIAHRNDGSTLGLAGGATRTSNQEKRQQQSQSHGPKIAGPRTLASIQINRLMMTNDLSLS